MDRPGLAARRPPGLKRRQQAVAEGFARGFRECRRHRGGNPGARQQIAGGGAIPADAGAVNAQHPAARKRERPALAIHRRQLPMFDEGPLLRHRLDGRPRRQAALHQIEQQGAQRGIGDVLAGDGADAGARVGAAGADRDGGGGDGDAERAGARATRSDRERHAGITAVASISTSHSGRASALTTRPVETVNTPFKA